jgi:arylsulfatase A-like enzyme
MLALLLSLVAQGTPLESPRPHIVVVIADDLADSDLDRIPTPTLDRIAARGVRLRRAYANPICTASRESFHLARWSETGFINACKTKTRGDHGAFTIAKMLDAAGYETGLFGKWHIGTNRVADWKLSPHLYGYEVWRAGLPTNVANCGGRDYFQWNRIDDGEITGSREYQTYAVRDAYASWMHEERGPDPRFAVVSFQTPHVPLHLPPLAGREDAEALGDRELYELMVRDLDLAVGRVVSLLDLERDWFVFFGDNGTPQPARHPDQDPGKLKYTTFEDGVNVPLIVAGPGIAAGAESDALVHVVDVAATLAEALGLRAPPGDGVSFLDALRDPSHPGVRDHVFSAHGPIRSKDMPRERAVITRTHKLRVDDGVESLFDLAADPREERDLVGDPGQAEILEELRALLARH